MKTEVIEIHSDYPELDKIAHCAKVIRQGGLVVFPTETVYGIAADYNNEKAMARLREVKKRVQDKPFSLLISQKELLSNYTSMTEPGLYKLIDEFWPGPLTVVVPARQENETIGIRMPHNNIALHLVNESQCSVAAPSANFEGNPAPSTCADALKDLDGLVEVAIDGGSSRIGQSSSVVDFTQEKPKVLREGVISQEDVDRITQRKIVLFVCTGNSCRSVMAEYLFRHMINDRNDVDVVSAGTCVFLRSSASAETVSLLQKEGIDATTHVSEPLNRILLNKADLILVMTRGHRAQVLERAPHVEKKIYLLREFVPEPVLGVDSLDIPDPMGQSVAAYEECMVMIKEALIKLMKLL